MQLQDPPGFQVRAEADKVTYEFGYRIPKGSEGPWLRYASSTAPGDIWVGAASDRGPWLLALSHLGVTSELAAHTVVTLPGTASGALVAESLPALYAAVRRAYDLAVSLPNAPLDAFQAATASLPRTTEAERLVVQRVGQNIFRDRLMAFWGRRCPITGIDAPLLLRASHIVPWSECRDDAQRLDVHNGLLLSALWDAAFDAGLVSFTDDGRALARPDLGAEARIALSLDDATPIAGLKQAHAVNLSWHRRYFGFD
jgi:HNH endonuclease